MEGDEGEGPSKRLGLAPGEAVAARTVTALGRGGRSEVRVRVVGYHSLGWLEVTEDWGARVEAVVGGRRSNPEIDRRYNHLNRLVVAAAHNLAPEAPWDGICLATVRDESDAEELNSLLARWRPLVCVVAYPGTLSRKQLRPLLPPVAEWRAKYSTKMLKPRHQDLGGVTRAVRHVWHATRDQELGNSRQAALMTPPTYQRTLQTVLDDTAPCGQVEAFEMQSPDENSVIGRVWEGETSYPVYDAGGLAPDVDGRPLHERLLWVRAQTVWRKDAVVRRMLPYELLAMWDYEGKLESKRWSTSVMNKVISSRMGSPPAKILRAVAFPAFKFLHERCGARIQEDLSPRVGLRTVGKTAEVPTSVLEAKSGVGRAAATPDDAGIDLSIWAMPGETQEQAKARQGLRKLAVRGWAWLVQRDAERWLEAHPRASAQERRALDDCVRRARACSYWEWHRGSRIMWFRLPEEWQTLFREGPRMFRMGELPKGMTRNAPTPSRSAELEVRKKIFKLNYRGYTEVGFVDLVQPRFPVVKTMVDGEVTDIRVVWNSRSNGYNERIWAPGFNLPSWLDAENMVIKWLPCTVATYLEEGSPTHDYTRDRETFHRSEQGDIDVGEMFLNFSVHISERHALGVRCHKTDHREGAVEQETIRRFNRLHFGSRGSPYFAYQGQVILLDLCKGDRRDPDNPFHWERVHLNLPGARNYDCSLPRVLKLRSDGELACTEATYVDDIRVAGRKRRREGSLAKRACKRLKK